MRYKLLMVAALGLALAAATHRSRNPPTYRSLDRAGEPLREAFNADAGKVRVLMLVAPT